MHASLKTTSFKEVYKQTTSWPQWARFLLLGVLVFLEQWWIETHVTNTVTDAIKGVESSLPPSGVPDPVYSETGDDFFDEMRLSAPWKGQDTASDSPQV